MYRNGKSEKTSAKSDWILFPRPNVKAEIRLFCFPYAGGSPHIFRDWAEQLPDWIELCTIQLPGRGSRIFETAYTRIKPLIKELAEQLKPFDDKPFSCFGHSMGALLAFEWTRFLRKTNRKLPEIMFFSGCVAPQIYDKEKPIYALPNDELITELENLGGTPPELLENSELMELVLPPLRADFELLHFYEYAPEPAFDFPIAAFGGETDKDVDFNRLAAWREQTKNNFSIEIFAGNHFYLHESQPDLLKKINRNLIKSCSKNGSAQTG